MNEAVPGSGLEPSPLQGIAEDAEAARLASEQAAVASAHTVVQGREAEERDRATAIAIGATHGEVQAGRTENAHNFGALAAEVAGVGNKVDKGRAEAGAGFAGVTAAVAQAVTALGEKADEHHAATIDGIEDLSDQARGHHAQTTDRLEDIKLALAAMAPAPRPLGPPPRPEDVDPLRADFLKKGYQPTAVTTFLADKEKAANLIGRDGSAHIITGRDSRRAAARAGVSSEPLYNPDFWDQDDPAAYTTGTYDVEGNLRDPVASKDAKLPKRWQVVRDTGGRLRRGLANLRSHDRSILQHVLVDIPHVALGGLKWIPDQTMRIQDGGLNVMRDPYRSRRMRAIGFARALGGLLITVPVAGITQNWGMAKRAVALQGSKSIAPLNPDPEGARTHGNETRYYTQTR